MPLDENSESRSNKRCRQPSESWSSSSSSSDSVFSQDASYTSMPPPPDGGYGWMIVFSAFLINFISDGISFSFGILYTELLDYFGESKSLTSWVGSLFYGVCLMGGPLASALATKFGCRKVLVGGAIVATFGTFISAFATDVRMLIVTFGVVTGIGMSMGYVTSLVMVSFYFEDRRSLATGLSVCGSGIGTFVFAPLTEWLINIYGWRGTMVVWSGIILNLVVCGCLLRPLEFTPQERRARALQKFERISRTVSFASFSNGKNLSRHTSNDGLEEGGEHFVENLDHCHSQIQIPTFLKGKDIPIDILKGAKSNVTVLRDYIQENCADEDGTEAINTLNALNEKKSNSVVVLENGEYNVELNNERNAEVKPTGSCLKNAQKSSKQHGRPKKHVQMSSYLPLYRKGLFFRRTPRLYGPRAEVRSSSCPELSRRRWESDSSESSDEDDWDFLWRYLHLSKHVKRVIKMMIDPSILKHPLYVLFAVSNFILYFWYDVPYMFMTDRAIELGVEETKASFLLSSLGIVNTVGQIFYGVIGDWEVNLDFLYGTSLMLCGVSVFIVPMFVEFIPLAVLSALFGFFISVNYSLCTVMLVEYLGLDKLANAYGMMMLVQGVANLVGPPVAAAFYDQTLSYDMTFYCGGAFIVSAGALLIAVPVVRKCQRRCYPRSSLATTTVIYSPSNTAVTKTNHVTFEMEEKHVAMDTEKHVAMETDSKLVANCSSAPDAALLVERNKRAE